MKFALVRGAVYLWVVDESCQPEFWYSFDDVVSLLVKRFPKLVILLFDF